MTINDISIIEKKTNKKKYWFSAFSILFSLLTCISALVFLIIFSIDVYKGTPKAYNFILYLFITIFLYAIFLSINIYVNIYFYIIDNYLTTKILFILILSINPFAIIYFLNKRDIYKIFVFGKFKSKFSILDITFTALILSVYIIFDYATSFIKLPIISVLSLKLIPIFFSIYVQPFLNNLILLIICNVVSYLLPSNWDVAKPLAYIFDYIIPTFSILLCYLFLPKKSDKKVINKISWVLFVSMPVVVIFFSRTIASVIFYAPETSQNYDIWIYAFSINVLNTIFDFVWFILVVPTICTILHPIKESLSSYRK